MPESKADRLLLIAMHSARIKEIAWVKQQKSVQNIKSYQAGFISGWRHAIRYLQSRKALNLPDLPKKRRQKNDVRSINAA